MSHILAITAGDIAGIGPEVILRAISHPGFPTDCLPLLIGPADIFRQAADLTGLPWSFHESTEGQITRTLIQSSLANRAASRTVVVCNPNQSSITDVPRRTVSALAGDVAFRCLSCAVRLVQNGLADGIVTAPLNKESLHLAGHLYPGHTEILAEQCGVREFAMMLHLPESSLTSWRDTVRTQGDPGVATGHDGLSIAHVTLHTSIQSVPELLTTEQVEEKIRLMHSFLMQIQSTRAAIGVCALNPHGGEHGLFGDEEARVIEPAVLRTRAQFAVTGPLPTDTLIRRAVAGEFDGIVAMYHDQGHIPVKLIGFDSAINITLGLPIIRTSPTHGTAFDRAWNAETPANPRGMLEAIRMASVLVRSRTT